MLIHPRAWSLTSLLRRAAELRPQHISGSAWHPVSSSSLDYSQRNYSNYCPIFSLGGQSKHLSAGSNSLVPYNSSRSAITSSGFYAPVNPQTEAHLRTQINREPRGVSNVFEDSDHLPSLPVPNLYFTIERLKESISPVAMNSTELINTLRLIDEFAQTAGPKLDLLLRSKAHQRKNWLTDDWWINETYLRSRQPLVINSNPAMIYPGFPFEVNNQRATVNTIAHLISGIIDFKLALLHGYNPEATDAHDEFRLDGSLCYRQYRDIFGSTRVPGVGVDTIQQPKAPTTDFQQSNQGPMTIVVSFKGQFFEIQLNNIEDDKARTDHLVAILDKIIESGSNAQNVLSDSIGLGTLTAAERNEWAKVYQLLDADSIRAIQESDFVVCIDTVSSESKEFSGALLDGFEGERHSANLGRQVLHADGANVGNRWFDKALQLIVVTDAKSERFLGAGINYEHTCAEGIVISKLVEYSYDRAVQRSRESSNSNFFAEQQVSGNQQSSFKRLKMLEDSRALQVSEYLKRAKEDHLAHIAQFDLSYFDYRQYGSNSIKSWNLSPDSWMQVAILSGYYNAHKRFGPCYETASTRQFANGRTETIRSLTKEVAQFCLEPNFETLQSAIRSHKTYARSANNGQAIDRVLLGYRMTFNEIRDNCWSWGIPTSTSPYDEHSKASELQKLVQLGQKGDLREGQEFGLSDVFSDKELGVICSFFNNELIKRSSRFALSTSQVSSVHPGIYMTYGPILADGYGCCYNITGQRIVAAITANSSNQSFSCEVDKLNSSIKNSLEYMRDIMEENRSKSGNK